MSARPDMSSIRAARSWLANNAFVRGVRSRNSSQIALGLLLLILGFAFLGPLLAPYPATKVIGVPFGGMSNEHLFGTDYLGRDLLSRFLHGGKTLIIVSALATLLAYLIGISLGMMVGYGRGLFDLVTVAAVDLVLSVPPLVLVLVLLSATGPRLSTIIIGIAIVHLPRIVRIVRSATSEIVTQEYVEAAVARGEGLSTILRKDILPNIWTPILADIGIRFTNSVILFSSLSYLGLGQAPPAADWGLMISENRVGLMIQPWVVIVPATTIALLTISTNLLTDMVSRNIGGSSTRGA